MFDIKPTGESASLVLSQIRNELDLHTKKALDDEIERPKTAIEASPLSVPFEDNYWEELITKLPQRPDFPAKYQLTSFSKTAILKELERTMREQVDVVAELASVGGQVHRQLASKPRAKINTAKKIERDVVIVPDNSALAGKELEEFWVSTGVGQVSSADLAEADVALESEAEIAPIKADLVVDAHPHSPASREIDMWLENVRRNSELLAPTQNKAQQKLKSVFRIKPKWSSWFRFNPVRGRPAKGTATAALGRPASNGVNRKAMVYFLAVTLSGMAIWGLVGQKGLTARDNVVQNGNNAVANLEQAKQELEGLNFLKAADSFALAYDDLNKASGTLNQLGASFLSVFGNLPGLNKIKAANNIVEAGQSLSKAGENLSLAFGTLYKTNLFSFLDPDSNNVGSVSISKLLTEFKDILNFADKNINRADRLLADIDSSVIPPDKQELFLDFKAKIPDFQKYIGEAIDYSDFLLRLVGSDGAKTYLVLLQNNSELRPTGGFPGSYALITFENGALKKIFVDDIYRADAGLKKNIVPPIPLQHITPNWGARDAGWFADFPFSARKTIELYQLGLPAQAGGGSKVDGVLTITPDVIARIFEVIGPIEMPEYGLTLDANNFLAEIQNEVEYEADRSAPKQILSDLQPRFFERLANQDKDGWLKIFKIISDAGEQKHILAYFEDRELEEASVKNGLGGEMKQTVDDYLQVAFANVKGSKTDFVTENSMNLESEVNSDGEIGHTLKISRVHNGGDSQYGFYNRDNSAYIKVYVPAGSTLEGIQGQSITDYRSLIGHEDFGFKRDPDLEQIESSIKRPFAGVDVFEESGKTVFGFWLVTKPKQMKSIVLKYRTQVSIIDGKYNLLWQKQSGTGRDQVGFSFKVPGGKRVLNQNVELQTIGDSLVLDSDLAEDRSIDILFR